MPDKTALGISEELRQFIEALVEEVVLDGKSFENHKKYLQRFCKGEGVDYNQLETNLTNLFETAEELKVYESKGSERLLRLLGKECYLTDDEIEKNISVINNKRGKTEIKRKAQEEVERKAEAERKAKEERKAEIAKQEAERIAKKEAERKAHEEAERQAREEQERRAKLIANNQKKLEEPIFNAFPNVKRELMCLTTQDNFYDYYSGYRNNLSRIEETSDKIFQLLNEVDSRQSAEYSNYSTEAHQYIERVKNAHAQWEEIKAMIDEGEMILRKGQRMRGVVIRNREEVERKIRIRKQSLIAALWTIIILVCLFGLCWWLFFLPNSDKVTIVNDPAATIDSYIPSIFNTENETSQNGPIKAIDLGLPSGTKWANCNVGATKPWEYGGYYAWGELEEKTEYWDDNYAYYSSCLWGLYTTYHDIGTTICETKYDVAHVKWGEKWQMPMREQVLELMEICKREWTTLNGVEGCMFTGPNGNNIFLPAAGKREFTELHTLGNYGNYWSGAQDLDSDGFAHSLDFSKEGGFWSRWPRYYGLSVRPVLTDNGTLVH